MPSFDVVSEVDKHESTNVVDQAGREIANRWDFKGADASFALNDGVVVMLSNEEFQLEQMKMILETNMGKRGIKASCLEYTDVEGAGKQVRIKATIRQGIDKDIGRKMVKKVKESGIKVQVAIQGENLRITGKKRDDLQEAMALLKAADDINLPLQFKNFKD